MVFAVGVLYARVQGWTTAAVLLAVDGVLVTAYAIGRVRKRSRCRDRVTR